MKWLRIGSLTALVAVLALMAFGTAAFALGPVTTPPAPGLGLEMNASDPVAALTDGKTIADMAKDQANLFQSLLSRLQD